MPFHETLPNLGVAVETLEHPGAMSEVVTLRAVGRPGNRLVSLGKLARRNLRVSGRHAQGGCKQKNRCEEECQRKRDSLIPASEESAFHPLFVSARLVFLPALSQHNGRVDACYHAGAVVRPGRVRGMFIIRQRFRDWLRPSQVARLGKICV